MSDTELLRRVKALEKHEHAVIERQIDDIPETAKFWRIVYCGGDADSAIGQVNLMSAEVGPYKPPLYLDLPRRPLAVWDRPTFRWIEDDRSVPAIHVYRVGHLFLVSDVVLSCILDLDPDAVEHRRAVVENLISQWTWHVIMPARPADPIDLPRTRVELRRLPLFEGDTIFMRYIITEEGYSVRQDLPETAHLISNTYGADVLFSTQLIDRMRGAGVHGVCFERTEGYYRLPDNRSIQL